MRSRPTRHGYQPWWTLPVHLLARLDRGSEAAEAFERWVATSPPRVLVVLALFVLAR